MTSILTLISVLTLQITPPVLPTKTQPLQPPPAITAPTVTGLDNPNHCDESTQWIASEPPYYCIPKEKPATQHVYTSDGNLFPYGQCTWYVKTRRPDVSNLWGNANQWVYSAQIDGWATGPTPRAGAIGMSIVGMHVVYVEAVNADGTILIAEGNWDYNGSIRERIALSTEFYYIY